MRGETSIPTDTAEPQAGPSRVWETPTIEEVDFASTEAAYAGVGPDLGLYHS